MRPVGHDYPNAGRPTIALFAPSLRGGGAERVMLSLSMGLAERGMLVDLVLVRAEGEYLGQVPKEVRLIDLNSHRTALCFLRFLRYLRQERPDVIVPALTPANVVALTAKLLFLKDLRVIVRQDNMFSEEFHYGSFKERWVLRLLKWLLPVSDEIVSVSQGVSDDLCSVVPSISEKVTTIYNPVVRRVHHEEAMASVEHPWFSDENIPVIMSVGRLVKQKDHPTLLRAFAQVVTSRPARLVILGEGPERRHLIALAERIGIARQMDMPGFCVNPFAYMSKSRVFVLSSRYEGLGIVLIEAMASGTPVVSTDCRSGPREILEDGKWGSLVPVGDWRAMAEAIVETLDNPIPSDQLISRASAFSADASIDRYLEVLTGSLNFAYMSKSRVFVLSSRYEGLGIVLIEAMASGTPVVSTDCRSGPREILEDGKWGSLVPVGDWRAMAEAIVETLDNPIPSDQLISRASAFSADASIDRYLEVLTGSLN